MGFLKCPLTSIPIKIHNFPEAFLGISVPPVALNPTVQARDASCRLLLDSCVDSPYTGISVSSTNNISASHFLVEEIMALRGIAWPLCRRSFMT